MRPRGWRGLLLALGMLLPGVSHAQYPQYYATSPLMDERVLHAHGLERAWTTQLQTGSSRLAGATLHASGTKKLAVHEVLDEAGRVLATFTDRQLDPFGKPLGTDAAHRKAAELAAKLESNGTKATVSSRDVPDLLMVLSSRSGTIQAVDAETGQTRWEHEIGNPHHPTTGAAINDKYVAVVNGARLYMMERESGKFMWNREVDGTPAADPAMSGSRVFVLDVVGMMQTFSLTDPKRPIAKYRSSGRAFVRPVVTGTSLVWPTDRGHFYVAPNDRAGIYFRIEARRSAVAPAAYLPPYNLILAATDGDVWCVHELNGRTLWRYPLGESVAEAPATFGKKVYVVTEQRKLYCLDGATGLPDWWQEGITNVLAASESRLYCRGAFGQLTVLDIQAGGRLAELPGLPGRVLPVNSLTDRIYLADEKGRIQCLREAGSRWPTIHSPEAVTPPVGPATPAAGGAAPPPAAPPAAAPADPFGGGAPPAADPFGGGADPFGGGGGGGAAPDPFATPPAGGAAPDPFGAPPAGGAAPDPFGS